MWYGLCTQAAKDEAEKFANDNKVKRNSETISKMVAKAAINKAKQSAADEALWKQMKRQWGGRMY